MVDNSIPYLQNVGAQEVIPLVEHHVDRITWDPRGHRLILPDSTMSDSTLSHQAGVITSVEVTY